jgi:hypothetical protein
MTLDDNNTQELWLPVGGYEGYYDVSSFGQVRSLGGRRGSTVRVLKPASNGKGYLAVSLSVGGKAKTKLVHQLVAKSFVENESFLPHVNHMDGVKTNNRFDNLEYVTHQGNMSHAVETGLLDNKGMKHGKHKLKDGDVVRILDVYDSTVLKLSQELNVSKQAVKDVISRKTWNHISLKDSGEL